MKTFLECVPCFFSQALEAAKLCGADETLRKRVIDEVASLLPDFSLEASPPEMGRMIHGIVKKLTGISDPYLEIKRKSNLFAMDLYEKFKSKAEKSPDSLLTALEMAVAGNVIDFGVKNSVNVEKELERILATEDESLRKGGEEYFAYSVFRKDLERCADALYLADNAGETVFDRILIEEIVKRGIRVEYAVKERPVINDALKEDAEFCGIHRIADVISSGSDAPGTVRSLCSEGFLRKFRDSSMVISKGQGNFEALSSSLDRSVFFLFMAKCPVVAADVGCSLGDILLLKRGGGE